MWRGKEWQHITASEAAQLHPGGRVSAHSGLFMCELCGQYVLLTDGHIQIRHFRHSSAEKSKDCPERTFGTESCDTYVAKEHELPIRIKNITSNSFELEIGFLQIPSNLITSNLKIVIIPNLYEVKPFIYMKERLNREGITYLSIGDILSEKYSINVTGTSDVVYQFWPKVIQGIDPNGTVFDVSTGKKLVYDSDVVIGKKYYLLRRKAISNIKRSYVTIREISLKSVLGYVWHLYEIIANDYDESTARFFLDFHCRLTEKPISIQPVWPIYVENPYIVKHNQKSIVMHLTGNNVRMRAFPKAEVKKWICTDGSVYEFNCNSRQQLISAGRMKALQYTYFWREPLNQVTNTPTAIITDLQGTVCIAGKHYELPKNRTLRFVIPYDGMLSIRQNDVTIEKIILHANTPIEVDNIIWNMELELCVGLDVVWKAFFCHKAKDQDLEVDKKMFQRLNSYGGSQIAVPHTMGSLASKLSRYPMIKKWVYKCIRIGYMNERAYHELRCWIRTEISNEINR